MKIKIKFGFYVSNEATRIKKFIDVVSTNKLMKQMISNIDFIYHDNISSKELKKICKIFEINLAENNAQNKNISNDLLTLMESNQTDLLFVFGSKLLKGKLLNKYQNKIINFHPSLLPAFPGLKSIDKAVNYGSLLLGNTAHFIDSGVDTGQIIMQNIFVKEAVINYDSILDNQISMLIQLIFWFNEERIIVLGRDVIVQDAKYSLSEFIPNIEFSISN